MTAATMSCVETLLRADGVPAAQVDAVRAVLADDGMVRTKTACEALKCSRWTIDNMVRDHGIRKVKRHGRAQCLVHLPSLMAVRKRVAM